MERTIKDEEEEEEKKHCIVGFYFIITFVLSLRGNEGFMIEVKTLIEYIDKGKEEWEENPHVLIPLLGRFKNEDRERLHKMLAASVTKSGSQVQLWTEVVVEILKDEGNVTGPAICDAKGYLLSTAEVDAEFRMQLQEVMDSHPELFPGVVDIEIEFGISRLF